MKESKERFSRREFISKYFYKGTIVLSGSMLLFSGSSKIMANKLPDLDATGRNNTDQDTIKKQAQAEPRDQEAQKKNPCDDLSGVSAEELEKRKKLAYVNKTPIPDNHCSNCTLYIPAAKDKPCGGCMLFKGPVRQEGYCAYWAPISN